MRVMIVDSCKSSLVMTSEAFKDKITGISIIIAKSAKECLQLINNEHLDMIVVDFDLPDADGISLTQLLRKKYSGPILLTTMPNEEIKKAIANELFAYRDVTEYICKPIKTEDIYKKIEHYLLKGGRSCRRFETNIKATLQGPKAPEKPRPKILAEVLNMSINGAMLQIPSKKNVKMIPGEQVTLVLGRKKTETLKSKSSSSKTMPKFKAKVAWNNPKTGATGLAFEALSESNRKLLENILRKANEGA